MLPLLFASLFVDATADYVVVVVVVAVADGADADGVDDYCDDALVVIVVLH